MTASWRKLGLTLHVITSVAWLGAVASFLALASAALASSDALLVRSADLAMNTLTRVVIFPLCLASLLTGIVQSLITQWGLVRHYWVLFKLVLTVLSTLVLAGHLQPIATVARAALEGPLASADVQSLRTQIALDAVAALVVLVLATVLAIYKPRGMTPYGWREAQARLGAPD